MKTTLTILVFLMFFPGLSAQAQVYHPFPDTNAIWNIVGSNMFSGAIYEMRFGVHGDTLINATVYKKIVWMTDTVPGSSSSVYVGGIREDAIKRVYFIQNGFTEDLLYDFGAGIGDSIWYDKGGVLSGDTFQFWPQTPHYLIVTAIDSILLENNEYRKRWTLAGSFGDQWVEGIGSISWFGLLNPFISDIILNGDSYDFACFRQNHETLFLFNAHCGTCFCNVIPSAPFYTSNPGLQISISPNPARDYVEIRLSSLVGMPYTLAIHNMQGQLVYSCRDIRTHEITLSVSAFSAGSYILSIGTNLQPILTRTKLVVW